MSGGPSIRHVEPLLTGTPGIPTFSVDAILLGQVAKTLTVDAALVDSSLIRRYECGRITDDDCSTNTRFSAGTVVSGELQVTQANSADGGYTRTTLDSTTIGTNNLTVADVVVCVDLHNVGANNGTAGNILLFKDNSNYYLLEVGIGTGGTSRISTDIAGTKVSRMTVAKGIAAAATKRVKFSRIGDTLTGVVDGTQFSTFTSPTALGNALTILFGAPNNGSGTSDVRLDNLCICTSDTITVKNVPLSGSVRIYDATDTVVAQGLESGGSVALDMAAQQFPFTGYIKVFTDTYTTVAPKGRFPGTGNNTDICGGDIYRYNWFSQAGSWIPVGTDFAREYATTQINSHNGAATKGDNAYGAAIGRDGKVYAWEARISTGDSYTVQLAARGTIPDQHEMCEFVVDSTGIFHVVYGGGWSFDSGFGLGPRNSYYIKTTAPWSIDNWTAPVVVATGLDCGLMVDQADVLHLLGVRSVSRYADSIVYYSCTAGVWSGETRLANAGASWSFYVGDTTIGKESPGQKSLHLAGFSFRSTGTVGNNTDYVDCYYFRSTNAGANWKGLTGSNYTLPLTQNNTSGTITGCDRVYAGTGAYVARLCADSDNTHVHAAMWDLAVNYPRSFRGDTTSGWASSGQNFSAANGHGAIEQVAPGLLAFISTGTPGPNKLVRYRSTDTGATWIGPETMITAADDPSDQTKTPFWYWPKITPIAGSSFFKVLWHSRYSGYRGTVGQVTGEGSATLFLADVAAATAALLTVDAVLRAAPSVGTKTLTVDAVLLGSPTKTFTVDALLVNPLTTRTKTFTVDAVLSSGLSPHWRMWARQGAGLEVFDPSTPIITLLPTFSASEYGVVSYGPKRWSYDTHEAIIDGFVETQDMYLAETLLDTGRFVKL